MAKGKQRDRRLESRWRRIIVEHKRSGLSIRQFCRRGRVKETAFYFWRSELQRRQAQQEQRRQSDASVKPAFIPVHVAGPPAAGHIEIELPDRRRVHVLAPVDRQALADVLAVLEALPSATLTEEGRPC